MLFCRDKAVAVPFSHIENQVEDISSPKFMNLCSWKTYEKVGSNDIKTAHFEESTCVPLGDLLDV